MEIKEFILNDADFEKIKNRNTRKKRIVPGLSSKVCKFFFTPLSAA